MPVDSSTEASAGILNSRRGFFKNVCGAAALGSAAIALEPTAAKAQEPDTEIRRGLTGDARANASRRIRVDSAAGERDVPIPSHPTNGDDTLYANKIGSYSKGLPHNGLGEVDLASYQSLLHALKTCQPSDFESMIMGGNVLMTDPQAGAAYDLEGTDSHQLAIPPSPARASAERAGEMVENYWQALLRDVPFSQYGTNPLAQAAIDDLNKLSDFRGPKQNGCVTPQTLFRGFTGGDLIGPYLSQFFVQPVNFGALSIAQTYNT